ncbi:MAG: saccharopine dehydrogenase NADP-binding domain-containing protein [Rickettsiales bacterium]|nr:saccharopine dehydrogenase NADP-binding domain-containing protein [Rickettsiales bacterium]
MKKILILGGYGNFGKRISTALAKAELPIVISGRDQKKASYLAELLAKKFPNSLVEIASFDAKNNFSQALKELNPYLVINTAGPFQTSDYNIAKDCIAQSIHYIDLADGRDFVREISTLDQLAKNSGSLVISGASTVPALSSAVLEKFKTQFSKINSLTFGIAPGQKAERGLATTKAILTYIGKPLKPSAGSAEIRYGWQDLYRIKYPEIGTRWMANCDIPDLDLLPSRYNIGSIRFSAGMENSSLHLGIWCFSWLVRFGILKNLPNHAKTLLSLSHVFDLFGSDDGGMHMIIKGQDQDGKPKEIKWFIIAKNGDGPQIPTIPAIILAKKIISGNLDKSGAFPCIAMVTLDEYFAELKDFNVSQHIL